MSSSRVVFLVVALLAGPVFASEFTIDEWDLATGVMTDGVGSDGSFFHDVVNPFAESHYIELGVSSASGSYDFAWDETGGYFSIQSQVAAELISDGSNRASTDGWIRITPSVDLAFHIDSTMDFDLPGHIMKARMTLSVSAGLQTLYYEIRQHDTFSDGIGSGTLSINDELILPAGETWRLGYDLYLDTYMYQPGGEGAIGTATGSVDISFTVLPEPSTFGLLAMSGLTVLRRRRRRA